MFLYLGPRLQRGPVCGLVSLVVVSRLLGRETSTELLLQTARERGFTLQGEMFSVWHMAQLAEDVLQTEVRVEAAHRLEDTRWLVRLLRAGGCVLLPYDCAPDSSVCLADGHRAHWGVVTGLVAPTSSPPAPASVVLAEAPGCRLLQAGEDLADTEDECGRSVRLIVRQSKSTELAVYSR